MWWWWCDILKHDVNTESFELAIESKSKLYFCENNNINNRRLLNEFNDDLKFDKNETSNTLLLYPNPPKAFDFILYGSLIFIFILSMISLSAFIFNKIPSTPVDDATWYSLIVFGLQCVDFISDLNLSIEMINKYNEIGGTTLYHMDH